MRTSRTTGLALAALVAVGSVGGAAVARSVGRPGGHDHSRHDHGGATAPRFLHANWAYRPDSLAAMTARAGAVVVAEVTGIRDAAPLALPAGTPDGAAAAIPTQRVAVRVVDVVRGRAPARFELFRTGDATSALPGDPHYAVGERYVLFVEPRAGANGLPDGSFLPVAPDGRLRIDGSGRVQSFVAGRVADEVAGWSVARLTAAVSEVTR